MSFTSEENHVGLGSIGLAWLSFVSGCIDVLSFLKLGNLFASAMTGNAALLALATTRGDWLAASRSLSALLAFALGVALAAGMRTIWPPNERRGFRGLLMLEILLLGSAAILWNASSLLVQDNALYPIIVLLALGMGVQAAVALSSNPLGINTVVFTSALIRIVMAVTGSLVRNQPGSLSMIRPDLGTLAGYACGAVLAGLLVSHYLSTLIWVPMMGALIALGISEFAGKC